MSADGNDNSMAVHIDQAPKPQNVSRASYPHALSGRPEKRRPKNDSSTAQFNSSLDGLTTTTVHEYRVHPPPPSVPVSPGYSLKIEQNIYEKARIFTLIATSEV